MTYGRTNYTRWNENPTIIGRVERTGTGNVAVSVGVVTGGGWGGWEKTGHVVLDADDARRLAADLFVASAVEPDSTSNRVCRVYSANADNITPGERAVLANAMKLLDRLEGTTPQ